MQAMRGEAVKIPTGHPGGGSRRKVYEHGWKETGPWWRQKLCSCSLTSDYGHGIKWGLSEKVCRLRRENIWESFPDCHLQYRFFIFHFFSYQIFCFLLYLRKWHQIFMMPHIYHGFGRHLWSPRLPEELSQAHIPCGSLALTTLLQLFFEADFSVALCLSLPADRSPDTETTSPASCFPPSPSAQRPLHTSCSSFSIVFILL